MKRDILDDAIAFVENAEDSDALHHRSYPTFPIRRRADLSAGQRRIGLRAAFVARGKRDGDQQRCGSSSHYYSGIQGS